MGKRYTTNFLEDTNGSTGTTNQVLVSTATGIDWVDGSSSGIIGGPYLPLAGGTMTGNTIHNDNVKSIYGTASDGLEIYHDGSHSYINETGTGNLYLKSASSLALSNITSGSVWIECINNQVELKNAGSTKLTTTSTGVTVTGGLTTTDDITVSNTSPEIYLTNTNALKYNWMVAAQENVDQTFEITSSTQPGGSTYSTPALQISGSTSDATFAGNVITEGYVSGPSAGLSLRVGSTEIVDIRPAEINVPSVKLVLNNELVIYNGANYWSQSVNGSGKLVFTQNGTQRGIWSGGELELTNGLIVGGAVNIAAGQKIYLGGSTARMQVYHTGSIGEAIVLNKEGNLSLVNQSHGDDIIFKTENSSGTAVTPLTLDSAGDATFATQAFATTATSSGDGSSTLTTKGYVDGLITGATIYRGAWDPSGGGYGSPDLSTVTQTSGYYYICSAAGTAEPNGTGTEPDTWAVGDWVIYNDVSGTGQWQKIDNSSVLSGVGTGQTVALWEGASSVTDSETLGNAPITVSGSNTTFAGTIGSGAITSTGQIQGTSFTDGHITWTAAQLNRYGAAIELQYTPTNSSTFVKIGAGGSNPTVFNAYTGDATFAGDVTVGTTSDTVDRFIKVLSGDTKQASLEAYGDSQGTGVVYVGQSDAYGGGIVYNGDGSPAFGNVTTDTISFYRREAGTNYEVFRYGYGGATVTFAGDVTLSKAATPLFKLLDTTNNISLLLGADDANTFIRSSSTANVYIQPGGSTAMTLEPAGNVGIGTTAPFANATTNTGLNVDTGGHSSILIGDGINDGGIMQSSDNSRRVIIGANAYDSPTGSWSRWDASGAALVDVYGEGNNAFISLNVDASSSGYPAARLIVSNTGAIKFNAYTAGTLVTDASGNITASSGGGAGGPYLPLSAGSSYPLTDSLYITTTNQHIRLNNGSELGIIHLLSGGELELWGHGDGETINFRTGTGTGTIAMNVVGTDVGIGTITPDNLLHIANTSGNAILRMSGGGSLGDTYGGFIKGYGVAGQGGKLDLGVIDNSTFKTAIHVGSQSNEIEFSTAGSERMRIDANGNVGIGVTAPAYKLHVDDDTSYGGIFIEGDNAPGLTIRDNSGTSESKIYVQSTAGSQGNLRISSDNNNTATTPTIEFLIGNSHKMRILDSGNVGIGTTAPTSKLHSVITTAGDSALKLQDDTGSVFDFQCGIAGVTGDALVIKDTTLSYDYLTLRSGNVGIGTTAPDNKLDVVVSDVNITPNAESSAVFRRNGNNYLTILTGSTNQGGILFGNAGDANDGGISYTHSTQTMAFSTADAERMSITSAGDIYVSGGDLFLNSGTNYNDKGVVYFSNERTAIISDIVNGTANGDTSLDFQTRSAGARASAMFIDEFRNVGIGTTAPNEILHLNSSATPRLLFTDSATGSVSGSDGMFLGIAGDQGFNIWNYENTYTRFAVNNSEAMRITSGGNVVIGTTTSGTAYALEVHSLVGQTGSIEGRGSIKITSGALGVNVTPSGTAGRIDASNDIVAYSSSDERLKENITPITDATEKVKQLTGIEFDWKEEFKDAHGHEGHDTGVIAQQVLEVMPTAVRENDNGYLAVRYEKLIGLLIESNKELAARTERLEGLVELMLK